jgi:site-specific DNA-cytosine methylase
MKAIGITCGIGSMLQGAKQAGFKIVGNVEWRRYYHARDVEGRNTFTANYPGAVFKLKIEDLTSDELALFADADIALGHPECGSYSQLSNMNKNRLERMAQASDIPLMWDLAARFRPRFIVMDDLPRSFVPFPLSEYVRRLPGYDFFPEVVSNWGYGNVQRKRERMFMIAARREERFVFRPGEVDDKKALGQIIGDLLGREGTGIPNHERHVLDAPAAKAHNLEGFGRDYRGTWREMAEWFKTKRPGTVVRYHAADGQIKTRPGTYRGYWDGPLHFDGRGHVLDGGSAALHHHTCLPYSIRERARIQGFPDDFVFYGTKLESDGTWNHDKNLHMVKQTGKAMPVQFCRYASEQVMAHVRGESEAFAERASGVRMLEPNYYVDEAKKWFCENVGYADQERACSECWLFSSCKIRSRKYQIGAPQVGQRDLFEPGVVPVEGVTPPEQMAPERPKRQTRAPKPPKVPRAGRASSRFREIDTHETLTFGGKK